MKSSTIVSPIFPKGRWPVGFTEFTNAQVSQSRANMSATFLMAAKARAADALAVSVPTPSSSRTNTTSKNHAKKHAALQAAMARLSRGGVAASALAGLCTPQQEDASQQPLVQLPTNCVMPSKPAAAILSIRQVLFNPGPLLESAADVTVVGTVVVLDTELGRVDLSHDGAKLIIHIGHIDDPSTHRIASREIGVHSVVRVTGVVKKQTRRTFLDACELMAA